ncbi:MAG: MOSC N-terminal beta barrel domain-containing protein [Methylococcaceae bacterium]|jgi:hypothetical protein
MTSTSLTGIYIYPIKSLAGFQADRWNVTETGLEYDRKWMLIDHNQHFLSQRKLPKMALITTRISPPYLVITAPQMEPLLLLLQPAAGERINSTIWQDQCAAQHISYAADLWFSDFLQHPCQLVYKPDDAVRQVDVNYAKPHDQTAFADGFPFLIISEGSLSALNQAMQLDLPMIRFRPNLVLAGCASYAEDYWREISIGEIGFRLPKPCSRCSIPNIDPSNASLGKEPLKTLNLHRKWQNQVYFGQNALHNQSGVLQLGDPVTIHLTGKPQPPLAQS